MLKPVVLAALSCALGSLACSDGAASGDPATGGKGGSGGASGVAGAGGSTTGGSPGNGGQPGAAGSSAGGVGGGGSPGAGGSAAGGGSGGALGGAGGGSGGSSAGTSGITGGGGSVNAVPADYQGTPLKALSIPGRINAADYDRGGAGVAWCHDSGNCSGGRVMGDWHPQGSEPYRPREPANAEVCGGAVCTDNVGVCRMNPEKPDNTITGQPMPADDTYLCYSVAGEWTKYTVSVTQAGTYAVGGVMAVPQGGGFNVSFGDAITTGNVSLAITPTDNSGSGENYHSWDTRNNLASVTFPAAGTYLMTLTQVGRFNADALIFTKM